MNFTTDRHTATVHAARVAQGAAQARPIVSFWWELQRRLQHPRTTRY